MTHSGCMEYRYTSFGSQTLAPKKHFSGFLLSGLFQKYVEVAIIDFTTHLIISKWLRKQK